MTNQHVDPEEVFLCDCGMLEHATRLWYMPPRDKLDTDEIYFSILLDNWRTFTQRVIASFKFIVKNEALKDGVFQPVLFRNRDMPRFIKLLSEQVGDKEEYPPAHLMLVQSDHYELRIIRENEPYASLTGLTAAVHFRRDRNFLQRLVLGVRYILARSKYYGGEECFSLSPADSLRLKGMAKSYLEAAN